MNKLILLSAVSGSGKSTYANTLRMNAEANGLECEVHSTDNYHMRFNPDTGAWEYKFDRDKLGTYHKKNQESAALSMSIGVDVVIIDNTNLSFKEIKPYVLMASVFDYDVEIVEPDTSWMHIPEECANRNVHGVPLAAIKNMFARKTPIEVLRAKTEALLNVVKGFS